MADNTILVLSPGTHFIDVIDSAEMASQQDRTKDCYDIIFEAADLAFQKGDFGFVDEAFDQLKIDSLSMKVLLAIFTISKTAKDHLPAREGAYEKFRARVERERADLLPRCDRLR